MLARAFAEQIKLSSVQTGKRLRGIVKTSLRQLARQAEGAFVMQSESTTTPIMGADNQIGSTHAGNSGAEAQLPTTSTAPRSSAAAEEYVPSTPATSHKIYFDSVQQILGVDY